MFTVRFMTPPPPTAPTTMLSPLEDLQAVCAQMRLVPGDGRRPKGFLPVRWLGITASQECVELYLTLEVDGQVVRAALPVVEAFDVADVLLRYAGVQSWSSDDSPRRLVSGIPGKDTV